MIKKIILTALLTMFIIMTGCNQKANIEETPETTKDTGLKNGVYYLDGKVMNSCIVVTDEKIYFFQSKNSYSAAIYNYTKNDNTINAFNDYSQLEIIFKDDNLEIDENTYVFKHEKIWFSDVDASNIIIDSDSYVNALTEDSINEAIDIATNFYNDAIFVTEIKDIYLQDHSYDYIVSQLGAELYTPGNVIILIAKVSTIVEDGTELTDNRCMTIARISDDAEWKIISEGH